MDRNLLKTQLPTLLGPHIPKNVRQYKWKFFDGTFPRGAFGFHFDPQPFEGKIVVKTEEATIIKVKPSEFYILDRQLITDDLPEGTRVKVTPYARRRFDGLRADTPEERIEKYADGTQFVVKTHVLGSAPAPLPVPKPRCPELAAMIDCIETMPAPDGARHISHLLVDAGARDFSCVDPDPVDIFKTPPALRFSVTTEKFTGEVVVLYNRGPDLYAVELYQAGEQVEAVDEVYFDMLGETLERLIDDGKWRRIQVEALLKTGLRQSA